MIALQLILLSIIAAACAAPASLSKSTVDSITSPDTVFTATPSVDTDGDATTTAASIDTDVLQLISDTDTGEYSPHKVSLKEDDEQVPEAELGNGEDMEGAETIVFRPLFGYRDGSSRRRVRDTNDLSSDHERSQDNEEVPNGELGQGEDMEGAETIVFRPLFGYRDGSSRRRVRDTNDLSSNHELSQDNEEVPNGELGQGEDMEGAETIVFRPLFGYRGVSPRRRVRDATSQHLSVLSLDGSEDAPVDELGQDEDMEGAENIVFRPLFRFRGAPIGRRVRESNRNRDTIYRRTYAARFPYDRYRSSPKRRNAVYVKRQTD